MKKGTYYIKVSADGLFRFRYRFTKVKQPKNTKQTKALNIKKGKTVKGILCFCYCEEPYRFRRQLEDVSL